MPDNGNVLDTYTRTCAVVVGGSRRVRLAHSLIKERGFVLSNPQSILNLFYQDTPSRNLSQKSQWRGALFKAAAETERARSGHFHTRVVDRWAAICLRDGVDYIFGLSLSYLLMLHDADAAGGDQTIQVEVGQ